MARNSTIFGPNESSRRDLFLEKLSKERNVRKVFKKIEKKSKIFEKKIEFFFTKSYLYNFKQILLIYPFCHLPYLFSNPRVWGLSHVSQNRVNWFSFSFFILPNEVLDKITSPIRLHRSKNASNIFSKIFRSFSKKFRLFRDFENFSRNRSRRDDSFGPKIVEFRAILAIFRPFEDLDVRPDVQRCRNWRCNLL